MLIEAQIAMIGSSFIYLLEFDGKNEALFVNLPSLRIASLPIY